MADFDFSQFFNPSAWGSWSPSATQTLVAPAVQNSPTAPSPGGAAPAASPSMALPNWNSPGMNMFTSMLSGFLNRGGGAAGGNAPVTGTAVQPGQGSGLGGLFGKGTPANNMMQNLGMQMLNPQMPAPPQIQMARPVGPGQMPAAQPLGGNMTWGGPNPSWGNPAAGFGGGAPTTMTMKSDGSAPQYGFGTPRQLGMLGNFGF